MPIFFKEKFQIFSESLPVTEHFLFSFSDNRNDNWLGSEQPHHSEKILGFL